MANDEKVLVLRTCDKEMKSHGGFAWPRSGHVECPDWDPKPECGGGLHGLLWGEGDWSLMSYDNDAVWLVVEVSKSEIVSLGQKVKFPRGEVVYAGSRAEAITKVLCNAELHEERLKTAKEIASGYNSKAASSGISSTAASSGDCSTAASSGYNSKAASSGYNSTAASSGYNSKAASSGYNSKAASSGDNSTAASSGDYSKAASSGISSTAASSGYYSTAASSGDGSKAASSGDYSKAASSGYYSKAASSGDYSTASAEGENTIAMVAGLNSKAKAGPNGCFALAFFDKNLNRNNILVGMVGDEIKADTWYRVSEDGVLVEE